MRPSVTTITGLSALLLPFALNAQNVPGLPPAVQQLEGAAKSSGKSALPAKLPEVPAQFALTGTAWKEWDAGRKAGFVEGFKSGTVWVASSSIVPPFAFKNEAVRSQAQKIWEQTRDEYGTGIANPKTQLPGHEYTALHMMMYGMYDRYQRNATYERAIVKAQTPAIVEAVDKIYADAANARMPVTVAIYLANKIANGASDEDVKVLLPYLRGERPVPPGWKIPVPDASGKPSRFVEFP